ncbi:hypothetical protein N7492_001202 [Penicillium capsulatum]|uniref:Uncharacterized protein n=1 Tax=Penicillium capsulatum TaxID=69766 RepID=A0A9W9IX91_9EURO|nr:hypothetical protein N7492_001202 [Penicillium capsulatum]KAJ6129740.1 hypothetical protein N7512_002520 [Penicillium capsulatum]
MAWTPFAGGHDTGLRARAPQITRSPLWHTYAQKGREKWAELVRRWRTNPLPADARTLSLEELEQEVWDFEDLWCDEAQAPREAESHFLMTLGIRPWEPACFDIVATDVDHPPDTDKDDYGISFHSDYCPKYGGLVAKNSHKETKDDDGNVHLAKNSWSDITWALWCAKCSDEQQSPSGLQWVGRHNVINSDTLQIIYEMRRDVRPSGILNEHDPEPYLIYTLTERNPDFYALLASPNGNGVFYLLKDHLNTLRRSVSEIRVLQRRKVRGGRWVDSGDNPDLLFVFSRTLPRG